MRFPKLTIAILMLVLLLVVFIPTVAGFLFAPPGWSWTGISSRNTGDLNTYLSIVEEIRHNGLRARNLFTAEPQPHFQIRPTYAALGLMGRIFPAVSSVVLLEAGRFFACLLLFLVLFLLAGHLFSSERDRVLAFLIVSTGSGLGWTHWTHDPPDLRIVETSTFLTLLSPPLYCVSLSLLFGIMLALDRAWESKGKRVAGYATLAGVLGLWLGFDHPFCLVTLCFAIAGTLIVFFFRESAFPFQKVIRTLPFAAGVFSAFLYQIIAIRQIPVYAEWSRQNILPTPKASQLLTALGFLVPLAVLGGRRLLTHNSRLGTVMTLYIVGSIILSHSPIRFQERFLEGLPACVAFFASAGIATLLERLPTAQARTAVVMLGLAALIPSSIAGLSKDLETLAHQSPPQYLPDPVLEGMRALGTFTGPDEAILCSLATGNFIPAYAARPVVLGHQIQTAHVEEKKALVANLFQLQATDPRAANLVEGSRARWIFWGPEEVRRAPRGFNPVAAPFLEKRYANRLVTIYRVR